MSASRGARSFEIVLIAGSPSEPSCSTAALQFLREYVADEVSDGDSVQFTEVFVRALPAEALLSADFTHPAIEQAVAAVQAADVVVLATPVYQAAYSGALKTLLDLLPQGALAGKAAVLPIATGGSLTHLLAIDYALKPVLSALGARHVLAGTYLTVSEFSRKEAGGFALDGSGEARLRRAAAELLGALQQRYPTSEAPTLALVR